MRTIKDLKAALTVGTVVEVSEHVHASLNGRRTVVKAQTKNVCLSFPDGHPKQGEYDGSWMEWPKRGEVTFEDDGSVVLTTEHGTKLLRLRVVPDVEGYGEDADAYALSQQETVLL